MPEGCCWGGWIAASRADPSDGRLPVTDRARPTTARPHGRDPWSASACSPSRCGYEDLNDHDELRTTRLFHVLAGKLEAKRSDCAPVAGKSTLNRLEHRPRREAGKYHKIDYDAPSKALFVDIFLDGHKRAPNEIVLDLDATDDTIHGEQEGRFCPWPTTTAIATCRSTSSNAAGSCSASKLRPANIDGAAGAVDEVATDRRPHPGPLAGCGSCCAAIRASAARS